jgi:hypothetical protein
MKKRTLGILLVMLIASGIAVCFFHNEPAAPHENKGPAAQSLFFAQPPETPAEIHAYSKPDSMAATEQREHEDAAEPDDLCKMFHADERDNLVLNESTRLNIEKLYALNTQEELESKLQILSTVLPPTAHRQLVHFMDYFGKYMTASKQIYPADAAPANMKNALDQLEGLHSLRVTHFGFEAATAFFAEEEKLNRQLLEVNALNGRWEDENMGI